MTNRRAGSEKKMQSFRAKRMLLVFRFVRFSDRLLWPYMHHAFDNWDPATFGRPLMERSGMVYSLTHGGGVCWVIECVNT